jgi:hypothetical protein
MRRFIGTAILAAVLTCSVIGLAQAGSDNGNGNGGQNNGNQNGKNKDAAPELNPTELVSGLTLLCGGLLLLDERRRPK